MRRGQFTLLLGFVFAALVGNSTALILKGTTSIASAAMFGLGMLSAFIGFVVFAFVANKLGR